MGAARLLIVDDELGVLNFVDRALSSRGYETEATASPRQALEIVKTKPGFDVLVTDVVMPEMCGPELVKHIARVSPSTTVVLMSACCSPANIPPHANFISKPFSLKDLFAVVERALVRSREVRNSLSRA
jgi:DNA-binding NtrC family response regulator